MSTTFQVVRDILEAEEAETGKLWKAIDFGVHPEEQPIDGVPVFTIWVVFRRVGANTIKVASRLVKRHETPKN